MHGIRQPLFIVGSLTIDRVSMKVLSFIFRSITADALTLLYDFRYISGIQMRLWFTYR